MKVLMRLLCQPEATYYCENVEVVEFVDVDKDIEEIRSGGRMIINRAAFAFVQTEEDNTKEAKP